MPMALKSSAGRYLAPSRALPNPDAVKAAPASGQNIPSPVNQAADAAWLCKPTSTKAAQIPAFSHNLETSPAPR